MRAQKMRLHRLMGACAPCGDGLSNPAADLAAAVAVCAKVLMPVKCAADRRAPMPERHSGRRHRHRMGLDTFKTPLNPRGRVLVHHG